MDPDKRTRGTTAEVEEARRLREEAATAREELAPAIQRLREQRAAIVRTVSAVREVLQVPAKNDERPSRW